MHPHKAVCFCIAFILFLAGCSTPALKVEPIEMTDNPSARIFELEEVLTGGRASQVNVLSPSWYSKSERYLDKARYGLANSGTVSSILTNVAYGHAYYAKAREYAEIARATIPDVIKARNLAIEAGAAVFTLDYQNLENEFISLTMDIENDNPDRAQKYGKRVADKYADLELRAIKENTLGEVRKLIADAQARGADDVTPTILAIAQKALNDADQFITEQRYDRERMQEKANYALFQAQRVGQIMTLSRKLSTMSPEALALWSEARLQRITDQLGSRDLRNESTDLQLENIIQSIIALLDDNKSLKALRQQDIDNFTAKTEELQALVERQRRQIADLEGDSIKVQKEREAIALKEQEAKERLEAEQRFQQLFIEVQGLFPADQAEVYKQAENLIIRLKTIRFPIGKDLIMPDNYPLLSQVRQAIRTFRDPLVVIEGHTDSTGSAAINEQLSQKRAEAVRQYFIANDTLDADKVTAIGYGSERPLATNDSPEGRAINRRIDVVIKAEKKNVGQARQD